MWTGLRLTRAIALSVLPDSDQHRMHGARLHLAVANNGPRAAVLPASLCPLIHVQLAGLHWTTALGTGAAMPGALYALPHPLHSPRNVRLSPQHYILPRTERPTTTAADVVQRPPEQTSQASRQPQRRRRYSRAHKGLRAWSFRLLSAQARLLPSPHISPSPSTAREVFDRVFTAPSFCQSSPRANSIYSRSSPPPSHATICIDPRYTYLTSLLNSTPVYFFLTIPPRCFGIIQWATCALGALNSARVCFIITH